MYEPLHPHAPPFGPQWPTLADWQRAFERRNPPVTNAAGALLCPVPHGRRPGAIEHHYEARIFENAELQVRPGDWHDCFNALVWLAFPRAKAALNARHYRSLQEQRAAGRANRGPVQDALTLFDEGGVVVASCDASLLALIRGFRWKELFWTGRGRLAGRIAFTVFGHALYEKAQRPFRGITGRAILLEVEPALLAMPVEEQTGSLDARLAAVIAAPECLTATRDLEVLPLLGVPGWHPGTADESFYDDADYFRPGRLTR